MSVSKREKANLEQTDLQQTEQQEKNKSEGTTAEQKDGFRYDYDDSSDV
ncbi:MAG: hypothetical protein ACK4M9_02785 [Anaerobacillus sp.]